MEVVYERIVVWVAGPQGLIVTDNLLMFQREEIYLVTAFGFPEHTPLSPRRAMIRGMGAFKCNTPEGPLFQLSPLALTHLATVTGS